MAAKDIPKGMTASQVNVLVGTLKGRVYRRRMEGAERDLMDDDSGTATGVGRQVTWLLDKGYIRKGTMVSNRAYYVPTDTGRIIAQGL
jgi:hypothetical protein